MKTLTLPTITRHGTKPTILLDCYTRAAGEVEKAFTAIVDITFLECDYPNNGAWTTACHERETMLKRLRQTKNELMDIANHCRQHINS